MKIIIVDGLMFGVEVEQDVHMGEPWKEYDGHGVVSEWQRSDYGRCKKAPHERVLYSDCGNYRTYDMRASFEKAEREGWGISAEDKAALAEKLKREPTQREIIAEAVEQDFKRLRAWCNNEWYWCGVIVTLLDVHDQPTHEQESVWGIESDSDDDYLDEVANDLAREISRRVGDRAEIPARPSKFVIRKEAA